MPPAVIIRASPVPPTVQDLAGQDDLADARHADAQDHAGRGAEQRPDLGAARRPRASRRGRRRAASGGSGGARRHLGRGLRWQSRKMSRAEIAKVTALMPSNGGRRDQGQQHAAERGPDGRCRASSSAPNKRQGRWHGLLGAGQRARQPGQRARREDRRAEAGEQCADDHRRQRPRRPPRSRKPMQAQGLGDCRAATASRRGRRARRPARRARSREQSGSRTTRPPIGEPKRS